MRDKPNRKDSLDVEDNIKAFDKFWESSELGIERILVKEVPQDVLHRFLAEVSLRPDYPDNCKYDPSLEGNELQQLSERVLKARKGDSYGTGYAGILIEQCHNENELPKFISEALLCIDKYLSLDIE